MRLLTRGRSGKELSGAILVALVLGFLGALAAPAAGCPAGPSPYRCSEGFGSDDTGKTCGSGTEASCGEDPGPPVVGYVRSSEGTGGPGGSGGPPGGCSGPGCGWISGVSTRTGNAFLSGGIVRAQCRGGWMGSALFWNSQSTQPGLLGTRWTHEWDLHCTGDDTVLFYDMWGVVKKFTKNVGPPETYDPEPGVHDTLTVQRDEGSGEITQYQIRRTSGRRMEFYGGVASVPSCLRGYMHSVYEPTGRIKYVVSYYECDPDPEKPPRPYRVYAYQLDPWQELCYVTYEYDGSGRVSCIRAPDGQCLSVEYDADSRPWRITSPGAQAYYFSYYGEGSPNEGRIEYLADPGLNTWHYVYWDDGKVRYVTDPLTRTTEFSYAGNTTTITYPGGRPPTIHTYDGNGNLWRVRDARLNTWEYQYDGARRLRKVITPELALLNKSWDYTYYPDRRGNLWTATDPEGNTTTYEYDCNTNPDCKSLLTKITDPMGHVTRFEYYTGTGEVWKVIDPNNNVTEYAYTAYGEMETVKNARNYVTKYEYYDQPGQDGRLKNIIELYGTGGQRLTHHYEYAAYDPPGPEMDWLQVALTQYRYSGDPGVVTYFYYDAASRLREINYPDVGYGRKSKTFNYGCCDLGDVTDENGNTTSYDYDALHRLWRVYDANHPRSLGQHNIEYQYDTRGYLWKVNWLRQGLWKTVTYSHDDNGNITRTDYPDYPTPTNEQFTYDNDNRRDSWTKGDGSTIYYHYYDNGLLEWIDYPNGGTPDVSFIYDDEGRRTSMTYYVSPTLSRTVTYTYDCYPSCSLSPEYTYIHGLVAVTQPAPGGDRIFKYEYDPVGNRSKMINPWNATHTYNYDHDNRLTSLSHPNYGTHTFVYDWLGNRTRLNYHNGAYATYSYNARNWLASLYNRHSSGSIKCAYDYQFDHVGNRTRADENDGVSVPYRIFTYDNLYQLKTETKYTSGGQVTYAYSYTYDEPGNITRMVKDGSPTDFTYDDNNKLLTQGTVTYGYDLNGNITSRTVPGQNPTTYAYDDYENRLSGITYPNTTTATFQYNGDGLRVRVREPDAAEEDYFLYDGVRPYARLESAQGAARAIYVSEGGTYYSPIVTLRTANANWTYLRDGMESVRKILNESQTTTDAYTFEAFGNPTGQAGTTVNPFRYVGALGYYSDRTTSLRLLGARYYGPSPRRFWTSDPASAGLNRYSYVGNAPTARVDPRGLWCWHLPLNICIGTTCKHDPGCPGHLPPKTPSFPGTSLCAAPRPSCPTIGPYRPGAPGTWMSPHTWQDCAKGHMIPQCQFAIFGGTSKHQDCVGCCNWFPTDWLACYNSCNTLQPPDMESGGLGPGYG